MKAWELQCKICKVVIKNMAFCEVAWIIMFLTLVVFYVLIFYFIFENWGFKNFLLGSWRELTCFFYCYNTAVFVSMQYYINF